MTEYYNKSPILIELGWVMVRHTSDGNSEYSHWAPAVPNGPCADIYVFEGWHRNSGSDLNIIWADGYEQAKTLAHDRPENGIPTFTVNSAEELRVILLCAIG